MFKSITKYLSIFIIISLISTTSLLTALGAESYLMPLMDFSSYTDGAATSGAPFTLINRATGGGAEFVSNPSDGNRYFRMYNNTASNTLTTKYTFNTANIVNQNFIYSFKIMINNLKTNNEFCTLSLQNDGLKPIGTIKPKPINFLQIYGKGDIYCSNPTTNDADITKGGAGFQQGVWYNIKVSIDVLNQVNGVSKGMYSVFLEDGSGLQRLSPALPLPGQYQRMISLKHITIKYSSFLLTVVEAVTILKLRLMI